MPGAVIGRGARVALVAGMKATTSTLLLLGLVLTSACASDDPELGDSTAEIGVDCGDLPLCECALAGTPQCADPDQDGLGNLDDDCDLAYDPAQADCDGDGAGDACDADNASVLGQNVGVSYGPVYDGRTICWTSTYGHVCRVERLQDVTYTTYLHVQLCGPSGSGYADRQSVTTETVVVP